MDRATYTLIYHWFQVELETAALAQTGSNKQAVASAQELEVRGALADTRKHIMRQSVSNGDTFIAEAAANTAVNVIELLSTGFGFDAIARGWLHEGLTIDIHDDSADANVTNGADRVITAVNEDSAAPDITVSGTANITTAASGDFITVANARSANTVSEMNGLRQIAGSDTSAVGGLDPDTVGEEFWSPAKVDTGTVLTLDLLLGLQRAVHQKTGKPYTYCLTSLKQKDALYSLLQSQVRFQSDKVTAGSTEATMWNGMEIHGDPDVVDRDWYTLTLEDLFLVTGGGALSKPAWVSDIEGAGGRLRWKQASTAFVDALVYPLQLAIRRRNSHASATALGT